MSVISTKADLPSAITPYVGTTLYDLGLFVFSLYTNITVDERLTIYSRVVSKTLGI